MYKKMEEEIETLTQQIAEQAKQAFRGATTHDASRSGPVIALAT
jgi:hypothetical protein